MVQAAECRSRPSAGVHPRSLSFFVSNPSYLPVTSWCFTIHTFPRVAPRSRCPVPRVLWALPAISVTHGHFSLSSSLLPHPSFWGKWVRPLFPRVSSWDMLKVSGKAPVATEVLQSRGRPLLVC